MFDFFKVSIVISALFFSCANNQKDKSISFEGVFESPTEIIGLYKKVSSLDNIISL